MSSDKFTGPRLLTFADVAEELTRAIGVRSAFFRLLSVTESGRGWEARMIHSGWPSGIAAITMFVEDLAAAKEFYQQVFGLPVTFEDDDAVVFKFGETLVNLLKTAAAPELIDPARVAPPDAGARFQLTLHVEDVDRLCDELIARGVTLLNGPVNRPWGIRTASFRDPAGHIWEIAK